MDKEMMKALQADGEKLAAMTGEDHGPYFFDDGQPDPDTCRFCGKGLMFDKLDAVCDDCAKRENITA